jgi:hypothetical protein
MAIELLLPKPEVGSSLGIPPSSNTAHEFQTKQSDIWSFAMIVYVRMILHANVTSFSI